MTGKASARGPAIARAPEPEWVTSQARRVASRSAVEIHLRARPRLLPGDFAAQARSMYESLHGGLRAEGARPADIVAEKIFLSDIEAQIHALRKVRREFYAPDARAGAPKPATTYVQQPPAWPGQLCEAQAFILMPAGGGAPATRAAAGLTPPASGRVVEMDGLRHVFLANVTGGSQGDGVGFSAQAAAAFRRAEAVLRRERMSFQDVVRTWIYLKNIDRDYAELNRTRRAFFTSRGVAPPPASTGIRGTPHPAERACALDVRAVAGDAPFQVHALHAASLNEAPSYGSDFARGMRVSLRDRSILYVSGTASIDEEGQVVDPGSIEGQVDRMLLNVERLLEGQGATYLDVVSAVTYLKEPEHREAFRLVGRRRGFLDRIPNTICVADICRPEWLCEMEVTAVLA